jgi:hypothetical protein
MLLFAPTDRQTDRPIPATLKYGCIVEE